MTTVKQENVNYPIWIDLNDITVENCFVSGGPYAQCPYQETVTTDKFVRMIAPSFVVAMVVLVLIFIEKCFVKHQSKPIGNDIGKRQYKNIMLRMIMKVYPPKCV